MRTKKRAKSVTFGKKSASNAVEEEIKKVATSDVPDKKVEEKEEKVKETPKAEEHKVAVSAKSSDEPKEEPQKEAASTSNVAEANAVEKEETKQDATSDVAVENTKEEEKPEEPKEAVKEETEVTVSENSGEKKEQDALEKDLETLKEPEESTPETSTTPEKEENPASLSQEETKKDELKESKDDNGPFTVKSAFSNVDGLYDRKKKSAVPFFFVVAAVAFVLGLAVMAGVDYWMKQSGVNLPNITTIAAKPTATPAPTKALDAASLRPDSADAKDSEGQTEAKDVDVSEATVRVLNGSGVKGEAAKVKTILTKAGFNVTGTGNADASDYKKTEIIAKKTVDKAVVAKLQEELGETYVVASPTEPKGTQTTDILVIIGSSTK